MLAIVRSLDYALNNTSLILLFEIGGTRLLFPGDAQIENWSYALFDAPNHEEIQARLAGANFYKVGHHGSLNATPEDAVERVRARRNEPARRAGSRRWSRRSRASTAASTAAPRCRGKLLLDELDERERPVTTRRS